MGVRFPPFGPCLLGTEKGSCDIDGKGKKKKTTTTLSLPDSWHDAGMLPFANGLSTNFDLFLHISKEQM